MAQARQTSVNISDPLPEETVRKLSGLRNLTSFDIESYVHDQHVDWVYRWVNKKVTRVEHQKVFGWSVVVRGSFVEGNSARGGTWNEGAGAWMSGDRILMKCRRDTYVAREKQKKARFELFRKGLDDEFRTDVANVSREIGKDVPVFEDKEN